VSSGGFEPADAGGALSEKFSFGLAAYCVPFRNQGSICFVLVQNVKATTTNTAGLNSLYHKEIKRDPVYKIIRILIAG